MLILIEIVPLYGNFLYKLFRFNVKANWSSEQERLLQIQGLKAENLKKKILKQNACLTCFWRVRILIGKNNWDLQTEAGKV